MSTKKIAETINIRINIGNFQHIEITKYAEKEISYETKEEMIEKEDLLTEELLNNIIRNMRTIPEKLGKKTDAVAMVEESIQKSIPKWLEEGPDPNIANMAKEKFNKVNAEQKQKIVVSKEDIELGLVTDNTTTESEIKKTDTEVKLENNSESNEEDLF